MNPRRSLQRLLFCSSYWTYSPLEYCHSVAKNNTNHGNVAYKIFESYTIPLWLWIEASIVVSVCFLQCSSVQCNSLWLLSTYQSTNHSNLMNSCWAKSPFSEFSFEDCQLPLNITFIAIWKAKWLWCLKYDRYDGLFRKTGNKSLPKAAQRWFRGQWIRTINPVFSCVWRRTAWGAS